MVEEGSPLYRTRQFAELAGVTVRTLHHYDRIGLLRPGGRTPAGYRIYVDGDLERLEQIVALKFIGLPLKRIRTLLDRSTVELPLALRAQRQALEERRRLLDGAIDAIRSAEIAIGRNGQSNAALLKRIIEVMDMQNDHEWLMSHYSEDAKAHIAEHARTWTPEAQAQSEQDWKDLLSDVEAARGEDPASERMQELAGRWLKLVEGFTGGNPEVVNGLRAVYADRASAPAELQRRMAPFGSETHAGIAKAIAIRRQLAG
ncbi:MAG: MerR family transcriptional regulator [Acidobacteria bacterium]|nr:MerR family transcriptional regulator [Acidobacteriota bacterium]